MNQVESREAQSIEDQLRSENESLRRQLEEHKHAQPGEKRPSAWTGLVVFLLLVALAVAGYYWGYVPRQKREMVLAAESQNQTDSLPVVTVTPVTKSASTDSLVLPGNIQAVTEAPVLARASGYIKKRIADIGDRVTTGQVLAEIEAPELDQQILQAKAAVQQADAAMQQAEASLQQSRSNENLAHVTFDRFSKLADKGVISKQDNDTYRLQWAAQQSNVQALEKAVNAAKSNSAALGANVSRLNDLLDYLTVRAPFAGVITLRNVDTGVLVTEGRTLLYRIAQTDRLRTYLNLPQIDAASVHVGQKAALIVPDLAGRKFPGTVTRTSNSLDPVTRTLLTEVQVENAGGVLMPGMYTQVDLAVPRRDPPLLVPGDTLVVRANGPQVAVVAADGTIHFQLIQLGRDFGDRLEVLSGVHEGDQIVINPSDSISEGAKVKPVSSKEKGTRS